MKAFLGFATAGLLAAATLASTPSLALNPQPEPPGKAIVKLNPQPEPPGVTESLKTHRGHHHHAGRLAHHLKPPGPTNKPPGPSNKVMSGTGTQTGGGSSGGSGAGKSSDGIILQDKTGGGDPADEGMSDPALGAGVGGGAGAPEVGGAVGR